LKSWCFVLDVKYFFKGHALTFGFFNLPKDRLNLGWGSTPNNLPDVSVADTVAPGLKINNGLLQTFHGH